MGPSFCDHSGIRCVKMEETEAQGSSLERDSLPVLLARSVIEYGGYQTGLAVDNL